MNPRYCPYGQHFRKDEGGKLVVHAGSGTQRWMCSDCQAKRRMPRAELEKLAARDRAERHTRNPKLGLAPTPGQAKDLAGQRFGKWVVLDLGQKAGKSCGHSRWRVRCDCGTEDSVIGSNLINGASQSCGCSRSKKQDNE